MKKTIAIVALCVLLAGCQSANNRAKTKSAPAAAPAAAQAPAVTQPEQPIASTGTDAVMYSCMKELNALQQVNAGLYQTRNAELNHIITQAKLYMRVRANVSVDIQQIMDAAYQFRISKTCNQIRNDLTNALVERVVGA
ncbi:TPA: hypothetical protein ACKP1B_001722 [Serratia fonticola]